MLAIEKLNIDIYMLTKAKVKHLEGQSHEKFDFELKKEVWWHNGWSHIYLAKKHFSHSKLIIIIEEVIFISNKIDNLFNFIEKKIKQTIFLNFLGTICSIINTKSFYRSKINFN